MSTQSPPRNQRATSAGCGARESHRLTQRQCSRGRDSKSAVLRSPAEKCFPPNKWHCDLRLAVVGPFGKRIRPDSADQLDGAIRIEDYHPAPTHARDARKRARSAWRATGRPWPLQPIAGLSNSVGHPDPRFASDGGSVVGRPGKTCRHSQNAAGIDRYRNAEPLHAISHRTDQLKRSGWKSTRSLAGRKCRSSLVTRLEILRAAYPVGSGCIKLSLPGC